METQITIISKVIEALDADSAIRNVKNDEILGAEACIFNIQVGDNQGINMVCLPIQLREKY